MGEKTVGEILEEQGVIKNREEEKKVEGKEDIEEKKISFLGEIKIKQLVMDIEKHRVTIAGKQVNLNPKEFELLHMLMTKKGKPLNRTFLTESIWGFEYFGTSRTIDFHIAQLRKKLKSHSKKISTLKGVGYKFDD